MTAPPPGPLAPPRPSREWGVLEVLAWYVGSYLVTLTGIVIVGGASDGSLAPRQLVAGAVLLPSCFLAATGWALTRRSARSPEAVLQFSDRPGRDLLVGFGVGFALQIGLAIVFCVFELPSEQSVQEDIEQLRGAQQGAFAVFAAVAAPIGEELFFRVLLFDALRRRLPVPVAVVVQGLAFGLVHAPAGWAVIAALCLVGLALGALFARGWSVWACVAAHMSFNALAVAQLLT